MTVETLILLLQKLDPTMTVFINDRDYGPYPLEPEEITKNGAAVIIGLRVKF